MCNQDTRPRFVFAVAGAEHAAGLAPALSFLRRATGHEIIVVQRAGDPPAPHSHLLPVEVPPQFTTHQAAIWLKTGLHRILGLERPFCYLDSDVLALSPEIDTVFSAVDAPIAFAPDHAMLDQFSRFALHCGCASACGHLREALFCAFGADLPGEFRLWNGGVFVARTGAEAFLDDWHQMTQAIFNRPYWRTRDQAVLAAAIARAGLQGAPTLPERFNTILDCYDGIPLRHRAAARPESLAVFPRHLPLPNTVAAHLINGGIGRTGWPHWDNLAKLLETTA